MKISLHGNSAVPYCLALHEAPAVSQRDPVEYHPSRQSKLLLTSAREVPCGFCHYSATTENSNHQQMTTASLFATCLGIYTIGQVSLPWRSLLGLEGLLFTDQTLTPAGQGAVLYCGNSSSTSWAASQYQQPTSAGHPFLHCS